MFFSLSQLSHPSFLTCSPSSVEEMVKEIQDFEDLQALRLEGNTVGVEAAQAIAKALETKSKFKVFILDLFDQCYFESCCQVHQLLNTVTRKCMIFLLDRYQLVY